MGESAEKAILQQVVTLTETDAAVVKVLRPLSMYLGPEEIILVLTIAFEPNLTTSEINEAIPRLRALIQRDHPSIKHLFIQPESLQTITESAANASVPGLQP